MKISITGTPGTGKTEVSKELSKLLNYKYIDLNKLAEEKELIVGFDSKRKSKEIDEKKLKKLEIPDNSVIDGHLSHLIPVDLVVVLRTRPDILKKRLEKRLKENDWDRSKIQENLEAEILGICSYEAFEESKKVIEIDTTNKTSENTAKTIKEMITKKQLKTKEIDWLEDYDSMIEKI